ncbi:MAG: hypothetical protein SPI72_02420 [Porphyromonas sp.]|nr:hypothetical protein [Porphyromonas sp.]
MKHRVHLSDEKAASRRGRLGLISFLSLLLLFLSFSFGLLFSCGVSREAQLPSFSLDNEVRREWTRLSSTSIDSLKQLYGSNKEFINDFLEPALIALSYFPDLADETIVFRYSSEATTMAARPVVSSLLGKRRYEVLINNSPTFDGILLRDVPFNAQIGVIGHELAHIAEYRRLNISGMIGTLLRYVGSRSKVLFEKETDLATIERGLGWQLYDWAQYAMYDSSKASPSYKEFKRETYMKPSDIELQIRHFARYAGVTQMVEVEP